MAIYGVGIDLVKLDRIEHALSQWGGRFEQRVFTGFERAACRSLKRPAACYALRFAAKEAFVKALGTGIRKPVRWQDVEVRNDERGKPLIVLSEGASAYCRSLGIRSHHLSLTDDGAYGAAVVILET